MKAAEQTPASAAAIQRKSATSFFGHASEQEALFFAAKNVGKSDRFFNPSTPLSKSNPIQAKLTVGAPNDIYEQEADSMADKVVQRLAHSKPVSRNATPSVSAVENGHLQKMDAEKQPEALPELQRSPVSTVGSANGLQMKCADCEKEEQGTVQRKKSGETEATPSIESRLSALKGGGNPLPNETRGQMEAAMGADFSGVRVHTGSAAIQMSQDLNAHAFTHGSDVYFNSGKYNPSNTEGSRLLAHELTHTVQQGGVQRKIQRQTKSSKCSDAEVTALNREMHTFCDNISCSPQTDTCATSTVKVSRGNACVRARTELQQRCYSPGDVGYEGHMLQIAQVSAVLRNCIAVMTAACGRDAVKVAAGAGAAYLIYRAIRMIPSLFPPLWPTIPGNLAIP